MKMNEKTILKSVKIVQTLGLVAGFMLMTGCAATYKHSLNFNPSEPLRVAVLPFAQVDSKGEIVEADYELLVDNIAFVSQKLDSAPANYIQQMVQTRLSKSGLDIIPPRVIEAKISHAGFRDNGGLDLKKLFATSPQALCQLLACDALVYGRLTDWDRSYYGLQTVTTVGLGVKIVSGLDGRELFVSDAKDSDSRGLSKGPTGISSVVLEPIRGLDNDIIVNLAQSVVDKMLSPLDAKNRQEFLDTPAPVIVASAHDARDGRIPPNGVLTVVALGSPGKQASFSIGNAVERVPMVERDSGHYIGEFYPLPTDTFQNEPVSVSLSDDVGRSTHQTLGRAAVTLLSTH